MVYIGTVGERQFALWCEQAGLTASRPSEDRYGWDFVVQFPHLDVTAPVDERPAQLKCMVQVKSTSKDSRRASIKLDNWERMINDPLPWFVCAIVFDGDVVSELFLVHVDHEYTERVLQRLRSLRATQPTAGQYLHESMMDVSWNDEDAIVPASPAALRDAMLRHVGNDPYAYGQRKLEWYENVGYDGHPRSITAHIKGESADEVWTQITDFSLGLSDKLSLYLQTITDERFGIPVTEVDLRNATDEKQLGYLTDPVPNIDEPIIIAISDAQRQSVTLFRCQVFHSATFHSEIPKEYRRWRFASTAFELLMDEPPSEEPLTFPMSFSAKMMFPPLSDPDLAVPLVDLAKAGRALRCMVESNQKGIRIELRHSAATWTLPNPMGETEVSGYAAPISSLLEKTAAIVAALMLDVELPVTLSSMLDQEFRVDLMWRALCQPKSCFPVRVPFSRRDLDSNGEKVAILMAVALALGEHRIVCAFAICGLAQRSSDDGGKQIELREGEIQILWKEITATVGWSLAELSSRLEETARRMQDGEVAIATFPSLAALAQLIGITDTPNSLADGIDDSLRLT